MKLLIKYLDSINSEYKITDSSGIVVFSENFEQLEKCNSENNICSYDNKFYKKRIATIDSEGYTYDLTVYSDVTSYINEINKSKIDALTQLPNRAQIESKLASIKDKCVVVMSDIDDFKKINDTYGHQVGDSIIKLTGDLIRLHKGENNFAGRYGGEEFLIIFDTEDVKEAKNKMDNLNFFLGKYTNEFKVSMSTGLYLFDPSVEKIETAVRKADEALYYVKHNGKNASVIYEDMKTHGNR